MGNFKAEMIQQITQVFDREFPLSTSIRNPVEIGPPVHIASRTGRMVVMKQGAQLSDRKSWSNMEIILLRGKCDVVVNDTTHSLSPGIPFQIPAHVEHQLVAQSETKAVVTFDALY